MRRLATLVAALWLGHCTTAAVRDPLVELGRRLDAYPAFSVILEDMRESGNFVDTYEHRYRVVVGEPAPAAAGAGAATPLEAPVESPVEAPVESPVESSASTTPPELVFHDWTEDWVAVPEELYRRHADDLGMVVLSKKPGEDVARETVPPGYQYVGDQRYGEWQRDSGGNRFWVFYGQYALLSHLFGTARRPVAYDDWGGFGRARSAGRTYYGPRGDFGTQGTYTRASNPTFFERQQQRQAASRRRFSDKVQDRASRSRMSGVRSRSGGAGGK